MPTVEPPRGNIGDWSELYTLAYLLVNGGAYAGDENNEAVESTYYKVLQAVIAPTEIDPTLRYEIRNETIVIYQEGQESKSISRDELQIKMKSFFSELEDGAHVRHFELETGNELLALLNKVRIKASSAETENDLELVLEDAHTRIQSPAVGFGIKSQLGSPSTLLNSSGSTNLIYRVCAINDQKASQFPEFEHGKHRRNLEKLFSAGFSLEFAGFQSETFERNLQFLDSNMGEYLGKILLRYYSSTKSKFMDVVQESYPVEDAQSRQPRFKIKEFLGAISMGMRPAKEWDGDTTKFKGIILVKRDGEIVFYYLHNRKSFEEYLYRSVQFDRPSTTRHQYGTLYKENGEHFLKLNLQIRFQH